MWKLGSIERGVQFIYLPDDIKLTLAEKQGLIVPEISVITIAGNKTGGSFHEGQFSDDNQHFLSVRIEDGFGKGKDFVALFFFFILHDS